MYFYASEDKWGRVADALLRSSDHGDVVGGDSEFWGLDVRKESCAGRKAKLHMFSVAIKRWPHVLHPRGYHIADAAVLLRPALEHRIIRDWLESAAPKAFHNLPVDDHSFSNAGVKLGGQINTLSLSRWVWPERARGAGFGLDDLGVDFLGMGKTESFSDIFTEEYEERTSKSVEVKVCVCGEAGCRKRKGHEKLVQSEEKVTVKIKVRDIPMVEVVEGHPRFKRACAYSARDPILGLGIYDVAMNEMRRTVPYPWGLDGVSGSDS